MTNMWKPDTEEEFNELIEELDNNPDFTPFGIFDMIQDVYEEMEYQGYSEKEVLQFTKNQYGICLEIVAYEDVYYTYFGNR